MASGRAGRLACLVAGWLGIVRGKPTKVEIVGKQMLVNSEPFHAKGVCWNPVKFNGSHPVDQDFAGFAEQDGDLMQAAGMNAVRVYDPIYDTATLDKLYERGIYVLINLLAGWDYKSEQTIEQVVAERLGKMPLDHPAILFWEIGNEWNYNCLYRDNVYAEGGCVEGGDNGYFEIALDLVKRAVAEVQRIDPNHPVATNYGELPSAATLEALSGVDMWGLNAYRGRDWTTFFDDWAARSNHPMYIGEYGADAWDVNTYDGLYPHGQSNLTAQADATRELTLQINRESSIYGGVVFGQFIFEFADEWWKYPGGSKDTHDTGDGAPGQGPWPDQAFNEEWWGIVDIWRNPRPAYHVYADIPNPFQGDRLDCDAAPSPGGGDGGPPGPAPSPDRDSQGGGSQWFTWQGFMVGVLVGGVLAGWVVGAVAFAARPAAQLDSPATRSTPSSQMAQMS